MDSFTSTLLVVLVLFGATFIRMLFGFGDALLAMPLLALIIGVPTATPLVAFVSTTTVILVLITSWQDIDVRAARDLILSSFFGIPIGLWLLKGLSEPLITAVLGVVLILSSIYQLLKPVLHPLRRQEYAYLFGFIAGILGGAYNTNGPPVVMYGTLQHWTPVRFRATLQGYFFPTGVLILVGHGVSGLWTREVLQLYAYSLPLIALAFLLGTRLDHALPPRSFERAIYVFLMCIGLLLIV